MQNLNYKNFKIAVLLSLVISTTLFILSYAFGKSEFFLILNGDLGTFADYLFWFFTLLGDGLLWIPLLVYFIYSKRKDLIFFLICCFLFTTIFTQAPKYFLMNELRPTRAISGQVIHAVKNVILLNSGSFPSGHAATAFTFYLIFCLILKRGWWLGLGLLYALSVGYSRVYLAQHFPFDVAGGIIVAVLSVNISIFLAVWHQKKKKRIT